MAKIVLGLGSSHGPMLSVPSENWHERVRADRTNPEHFYKGRRYTFDELVALRKNENLARLITGEECRERQSRCNRAIDQLYGLYDEYKPDVTVVVGNDQMEVFTGEHLPAFAVFWGEYVEGMPRSEEYLAKLPPGIARAELDRTPPVYTQYPCAPELGQHLIRKVVAEGFDVAQITKLPVGPLGTNSAPHAYGFIYRRVMKDKVVPHVPIFINTFYPPNQPTSARCISFGRALGRAIRSWSAHKLVAVVASGGLTHYVIDEAFDQKVLRARRMKSRLGTASALTATAHKLAKLIYRFLKFGGDYVDVGQDAYEKNYQERVLKNLKHRASKLGFALVSMENVS